MVALIFFVLSLVASPFKPKSRLEAEQAFVCCPCQSRQPPPHLSCPRSSPSNCNFFGCGLCEGLATNFGGHPAIGGVGSRGDRISAALLRLLTAAIGTCKTSINAAAFGGEVKRRRGETSTPKLPSGRPAAVSFHFAGRIWRIRPAASRACRSDRAG